MVSVCFLLLFFWIFCTSTPVIEILSCSDLYNPLTNCLCAKKKKKRTLKTLSTLLQLLLVPKKKKWEREIESSTQSSNLFISKLSSLKTFFFFFEKIKRVFYYISHHRIHQFDRSLMVSVCCVWLFLIDLQSIFCHPIIVVYLDLKSIVSG